LNHIDNFFTPPDPGAEVRNQDTVLNKDILSHVPGQLSLFPGIDQKALFKWHRDKVDFVELFDAVYESDSVKLLDGQKPTKKAFFSLLMWFFNIKVGHLAGTRSAAKSRKIEKGSPYLEELARTFANTSR
jgi:hypothetical protein